MFRKLFFACATFLSLVPFSFAQENDSLNTEAAPAVAQELNGLEYSFAVSSAELKHTIMLCLVSPCPDGNAVLETSVVIKNVSDSVKTLMFPNSNIATIEIRDAQNQVVASTETGMMYAMAIEEVTIQPGESKVLSQSLKLVSASAEKLVGDFTAVALVKSYENAPELSMSIKVSDASL